MIFYKNKGGKPGRIKKQCTVTAADSFGTVVIPCTVKLKAGTYWVSVQANMDFNAGGEWGWNTNNTVRLHPSKWQNPGDGFATGCTTHTDTTTCIPIGEGGDFSFQINGFD